jgi:hypothetical protein
MTAIDWSPHWTWFHYFVPSLWGNGPEAVVQTVVYGIAAVLILPPTRHWMQRHVDSIKEHMSGETKALHEKMDEAHQKIDHIIKNHPDIPDFRKRDANGKFK